jgi:hypothetical protein
MHIVKVLIERGFGHSKNMLLASRSTICCVDSDYLHILLRKTPALTAEGISSMVLLDSEGTSTLNFMVCALIAWIFRNPRLVISTLTTGYMTNYVIGVVAAA